MEIVIPSNLSMENSNPDNSNPDNSNPDNSNPDNSNPDNSNPDNSNPDNSNPDNTIVVEKELQYEDVNEGRWLIVVYEGEHLLAKLQRRETKCLL